MKQLSLGKGNFQREMHLWAISSQLSQQLGEWIPQSWMWTWVNQLTQYHLLKRLSYSHCFSVPPLSYIEWPFWTLFCSMGSLCQSLTQYHSILVTAALSWVWYLGLSVFQHSLGYSWPFAFLFKSEIQLIHYQTYKMSAKFLIGLMLNI